MGPTRTLAIGTTTVVVLMAALFGSRGAPLRAAEPLTSIPPSLSRVKVPEPGNLGDFVRDRAAAIRLGKALFWDMQVGSDGVQACATCHFHAGADNRLKNQLNPGTRSGIRGFYDPNVAIGDAGFRIPGGPNYTLTSADFPFHKLANPDDRFSKVLADTNDVASSQGVFRHDFVDIVPGDSVDAGTPRADEVFHVGGLNVRRVEPRNTPTTINAVFNFRNFWDGRAQNDFNGVNPFGSRDPNARVLKATPTGIIPTKIRLENSSLASQAVGPPLSGFESSFDGRTFPKIGKKLLGDYGTKQCPLTPLAKQLVHPNDSVLGAIAASRVDPTRRGLVTSYAQMIRDAFHSAWWESNQTVTFHPDGRLASVYDRPNRLLTTNEFTVMEANLALFWGIAIQLYEATLVSDDTPFDRWARGQGNTLSYDAREGLRLFVGKAKCINCHGGAELTNASVANVRGERLERMVMGNGQLAIYDNGFYNIGVRPTAEDLGVGGEDPFGNPLSDTKMAFLGRFFDKNLQPPLNLLKDRRAAVHGSFKTPGLRNVELTGPYFHNGGQATLMQVVEFYNRGGDFASENQQDFDPDVQRLELSLTERQQLVAFLKSLTDHRVRYEQAPFDHPQIFVPDGHPGDEHAVSDDGTGKATDALREIPAVGAAGGVALPPTLPHE